MKMSGVHMCSKTKTSGLNSNATPTVNQEVSDTNFSELQMKYFSLKNILTCINDDIKEIKHKSLNYVSHDILLEYNETIGQQISDVLIQSTPRDNSNLITTIKNEIDTIKQSLEEIIPYDDKYELLIGTIELLNGDIKMLRDRIDVLENKQNDSHKIPRLIIKKK